VGGEPVTNLAVKYDSPHLSQPYQAVAEAGDELKVALTLIARARFRDSFRKTMGSDKDELRWVLIDNKPCPPEWLE
jgi:hypothetical protein